MPVTEKRLSGKEQNGRTSPVLTISCSKQMVSVKSDLPTQLQNLTPVIDGFVNSIIAVPHGDQKFDPELTTPNNFCSCLTQTC